MALIRNANMAKGVTSKVLSFDNISDKLSVVAMHKAKDYGLIGSTNQRMVDIEAVEAKYDKSKEQTAGTPSKQKTIKTLPELPADSTIAFLQSDADFRNAENNAAAYLVMDESDLSAIYDGNGFEPSQPGAQAAPASPDVSGRGYEDFFTNITAMQEQDDFGLQMG
jgi:hypothetical protein